jgi:hypothetical protein
MRRVLRVGCFAAVLISLVVVSPSAARTQRSFSLPLHARVTLSGQTLGSRGQHVKGHVFATARWSHGARYVVATPPTDAFGRWRVTFHPSHHGFYTLRILTPDGGVLQYAFVVH